MLKATQYEILRGVVPGSRQQIPLAREPKLVATLLDEASFDKDHYMMHFKNVFLENRMHDWDRHNGQLRFFARAGDICDVLVVYESADVRFDPMTGKPVTTNQG